MTFAAHVSNYTNVKWRNCWWWWDAPRCLIGLDSWLLALDTTCPWFFAKSGIFFSTIYVKHLIHANLSSGLFYNAESLADIQSKNIQPSQSLGIFRMCALPLRARQGPKTTIQLDNSRNGWHKNQDRINNVELYTPFRMCALPPSGPDWAER